MTAADRHYLRVLLTQARVFKQRGIEPAQMALTFD